jgi:hypothetical protein
MADAALVWPEASLPAEAASAWVASMAGQAATNPEVLQVKRWGVTARFGSVILKVSFVPLFPQVASVHSALRHAMPEAAPTLLACEMRDGKLWTLFEHVAGPTVEQLGTANALVATARKLGEVQARVKQSDCAGIAQFDLKLIAKRLLEDVKDQPAELVEWLRRFQPQAEHLANELATVPYSLDHPDVNSSNAIVADSNGQIVLLDWEEATVGCPLLSMDRLLGDAEELACAEEVTASYLHALGPHTKLTTELLQQSQARCAAASESA